ncbi:hypothetical protein GCM10029992_42110 [Glycomyces albus]
MGVDIPEPERVLDADDILRLQHAADTVFIHNALVDYAVRIVMATRNPTAAGIGGLSQHIQYGASPRASLGLIRATRAIALLRGRDYALPQDLDDIAPEVLRHRLVLSYDAMADGIATDQIVGQLLAAVPAPTVTPRQDAKPRETPSPQQPGAW